MLSLYAISLREIAYKLSVFCALMDNPEMVCKLSPFAADATFG